ncbi:MAG TPA: recombinase family protein [Gemmata sp.]|jgi:DNA invertase Pin-like site-specific DNA recombinase|nr:recombinase family protein [Gemmata sp.]
MSPKKESELSPKLAYSYIRFSSPTQRRGDSARRQEQSRDDFIKDKGLSLDTKLRMKDDGVSAFRGKHRSDKNALGSFLKLVDSGSIAPGSYLLIENLDRLSREDVEEGLHLLLGLILKGIIVVQLSPVVTEFRKGDKELSPKLMMAIMELRRGNSESEMKSIRIGGAWENKRNKARTNKIAISKKCPHWLKKVGDKYEVIPDRVKAVQLMFQLCADGFGIGNITKRLIAERHKPFGHAPHWSNVYIGRILAGRQVIGEYQPMKGKKPEGEPITGFYPAVIDEKLYWRAQAGLKQRLNHAGGRSKHDVNLFAGLMFHALDGDRFEYRWLTDARRGKRYGQARYVNSLALMSQAKLSGFSVSAFEQGVLSCLSEIDPMEILPHHDRAEEEVMALSAQLEECETQLKRIEDRLVAGESVDVLVNAAKRLQDRKKDVGTKLSDARMRASNPQSEGWGTCHTLISALASSEDREAARLKLQSAIRRVVEKMVCLFVRDGRRQIACVQFHFIGSVEVRTVFIRHRGELTNIKEKTPEHLSWSTMVDGIPGKVSLENPKTREVVALVLQKMCQEDQWHTSFEPDRPTSRERIRLRKIPYMKEYKRKPRPRR